MRAGAALLALATLMAAPAGCRSAASAPAAEATSIRRALSVAFVVVDGVHDTELVLPLDVFRHVRFHAQPGMEVFTVAPAPEPVRTFEGLRLLPDHGFADAPAIDVLVVPGVDLGDETLISFVRERGSKARYVLALGEGAFVLARAGLLDGRWSTTFADDVDRLREEFPRLRVHEGVSFVRDGPAITSAGGAKSAEAALDLAELLHGREAARGVAQALGLDWDRSRVAHIAR